MKAETQAKKKWRKSWLFRFRNGLKAFIENFDFKLVSFSLFVIQTFVSKFRFAIPPLLFVSPELVLSLILPVANGRHSTQEGTRKSHSYSTFVINLDFLSVVLSFPPPRVIASVVTVANKRLRRALHDSWRYVKQFGVQLDPWYPAERKTGYSWMRFDAPVWSTHICVFSLSAAVSLVIRCCSFSHFCRFCFAALCCSAVIGNYMALCQRFVPFSWIFLEHHISLPFPFAGRIWSYFALLFSCHGSSGTVESHKFYSSHFLANCSPSKFSPE